ncbi:DUF4185 domain-containing protein [Paraburkholderia flagellata]|uniref:DUF4185 domain-containing protein n=1 Tax=Paraburkholderia flagellata TaxID=2883241 RepID=UPI001F172823|nr:DUF4185 domain-containing protein [Paraburkholderia flagellata]
MQSPPKIVGPLGPCSKYIRLQGQTPGTLVTVLASFNNVWDIVCKLPATSPDEVFELTRPLKPREHVVTDAFTAQSPEEIVQDQPDLNAIGRVTGITFPYACGECLWITNAIPGANVEVRDANGNLRGQGPAPDGNARINLTAPIHHNETLTARQFVCGVGGTPTTLLTATEPPALKGKLNPPKITGTVRECDTAVRIEEVIEGAVVSILIDDTDELRACFDRSGLWFQLGRELNVRQGLRVRQSFDNCELHSLYSMPPAPVEELLALDPPTINQPLCEGSCFVTIGGLTFGDTVTIVQDGLEIGGGTAWDSQCDFIIQPLKYNYHSKVTALRTRCGVTSLPSDVATVEKSPGSIPEPVIVGPLYDCGAAVHVVGLHPGARVNVVSDRRGTIGNAYVWETEADIFVFGLLHPPENISIAEVACGHNVTSPKSEPVLEHPRTLDPPVLLRWTWNTRASVPVDGLLPGAMVEVQIDGIHVTTVPMTLKRAEIPLPAKPSAGSTVRVRQWLCNVASDWSALSPQAVVQSIDDYDVGLVAGSVSRVCQLTGDYDPEGLPHRNDTEGVRVIGTDLGISVDHMIAGEKRTYFFFGDTADDDTGNGDSIFYTLDNDPTPNGPLLKCLTVQDPDDDDFGAFARLAVEGVDLPGFGVPTGAFSWDGRIYLFVTTKFVSDDDPMTQSFLGSAVDPALGFTNHGMVDAEGDPNYDFRFINIAPCVIANDDWDGLPDTARPGGVGVLLCGSGRYRRSNPYLAYVPIEDITKPRTNWAYFSISGNQWTSDPQYASPLFIDPVVGELSLSYHPYLQKWLLLYNSNPGDGSIVMRSATVPWGPWSAPCPLFFVHEGLRKFIHEPGQDGLGWLPPLNIVNLLPTENTNRGDVYGPYIVSRWNDWDDVTQRQAIYFTMSTWVPYQPQLMRALLELVKR